MTNATSLAQEPGLHLPATLLWYVAARLSLPSQDLPEYVCAYDPVVYQTEFRYRLPALSRVRFVAPGVFHSLLILFLLLL
jgi:hypothetical protein